MTSTRLILIFLGFIFLIIVILSSNRISSGLRSRFGNILPALKPTTEEITPTPTIEMITETPTPTVVYGGVTGSGKNTKGATPVKSIPASGPADLAWLVLGGSFLAGVTLKKITGRG